MSSERIELLRWNIKYFSSFLKVFSCEKLSHYLAGTNNEICKDIPEKKDWGSRENPRTRDPKEGFIAQDHKRTLPKRTIKKTILLRTLKRNLSLKILRSFKTLNNLLVIVCDKVGDGNKFLHNMNIFGPGRPCYHAAVASKWELMKHTIYLFHKNCMKTKLCNIFGTRRAMTC